MVEADNVPFGKSELVCGCPENDVVAVPRVQQSSHPDVQNVHGTNTSLSWAVNGVVSRSSGSIDATRLLTDGILIGVGPTRGTGFPAVT